MDPLQVRQIKLSNFNKVATPKYITAEFQLNLVDSVYQKKDKPKAANHSFCITCMIEIYEAPLQGAALSMTRL